MKKFRHLLPISCSMLGLSGVASAQSEADVSFFRDQVKPILQQHCFECHGASDGKGGYKIKSGLQLISRKGLLKGGAHGAVINEESPEKSLLLEVISYNNEDLQMPPKNKLSDEEIALITDWVKRGAPWTPEDADVLHEVHDPHAEMTTVNEKTKAHWSYKPMQRPAVPEVAEFAHPIDKFLEVERQARGLKANHPASRGELLRRATFDLTGLAPSLAEVQAFENDTSADAWEKRIDRLLALPQYGEKWGRHWLDLVRYAESQGFERDTPKAFVWRYRDYVIDAFNKDKPYDQFLTEQLAGDEIPNPTAESLIATGYHRLMQWDDEPADRLQHFHDVIDDNVRVTTETMLGMTVGCARCHDHKGDPIPQKDYFQFASFFRNISPMGNGNTNLRLIDTAQSHSPEQVQAMQQEMQQVRERIQQAEQAYAALPEQKDLAVEKDNVALITDSRVKPWKWHFTTKKPADDWFTVGFRAETQGWQEGLSAFGTDVPNGKAVTSWRTPDIWLQTSFLLEKIPSSLRMDLHHDEDVSIYCNGQLVYQKEKYRVDYASMEVPPAFLAALQTGRNVISVHVHQTGGGQYFDFGLVTKGRSIRREMLAEQNTQLTPEQRQAFRQDVARLAELEKLLEKRSEQALVVAENGKESPPTFIHMRGSAHAEGAEVQPGFPLIFGGEMAKSLPIEHSNSTGRRLALAEWITRDDNPRTARVMVNRLWQHHFGKGICATPNDFGFLGSAPTHPQLLDWLASEFVSKNWSMKAMHKLIMTSAAYQMSNRRSEVQLAQDPANETYWRFMPRRMTSEELRDNILLATGELNLQQGGPSIFVPIPEEVLATSSTKGGKWGESPPDQVNRRSVYGVSKRSLQVPLLTDHDQADLDNPCPVRFATIVPTQALGMINSDFIHEKARVLSARLKREAGDDPAAQVKIAYQLMVQRTADEQEISRAVEFLQLMRDEHKLSADDALQRFCVAVFSFNEFIFID
jgi:mono/diheme cytochrome c family protein